jgi:organic hydroperoxide reductase OsmC/OhrA
MFSQEFSDFTELALTSSQAGIAKPDSAPNTIHFTAPPQFGGLEGRWTPEDLLLTALASCFTTTFHAIAGCSRFEYTDLAVEEEMSIVRRLERLQFGSSTESFW